MPLINITDEGAGIVHAALGGLMLDAQKRVALQPLFAPNATAPASNADGPYSPELAAAFREGARNILGDDSDDYAPELELPDNAPVEPGEGGVWVSVRLFVSDAARALMPGEGEEEPETEWVTNPTKYDAPGAADDRIWPEIDWTHSDQAKARDKGWEVAPQDDGYLVVHKAAILLPGFTFADDEEAWLHVQDMAVSDDEPQPGYVQLCVKALKINGYAVGAN
jgi:hypothetical protein